MNTVTVHVSIVSNTKLALGLSAKLGSVLKINDTTLTKIMPPITNSNVRLEFVNKLYIYIFKFITSMLNNQT